MNKQKTNHFSAIFFGMFLFFSGYFSDNLFPTDSEICIRLNENQGIDFNTKRQTEIRNRFGGRGFLLFCQNTEFTTDKYVFSDRQTSRYFSECFTVFADGTISPAGKIRPNISRPHGTYWS